MGIMKETQLSLPEQTIFAKASLALKYGDEEDSQPISHRQLLSARRSDDRQNDLWSKLNVVQENLLRGGQHGQAASGETSYNKACGID